MPSAAVRRSASRRSRRPAEGAAHRRGVPAAGVERAGRRHAQARDGLVAGHRRRDQRAPVERAGLAERERHRHHHRGGVGDRRRVGVVEVEAVGEGAVGEDGQRRRRRALGADHRAVAGGAPALQRTQHRGRRLGGGRGQRDPEDVERAQAHAGDHSRREVLEPQRRGELRQPAGERHALPGMATLPSRSRLRSAITTRPSPSVISNSSTTPASSMCCTSCSRS